MILLTPLRSHEGLEPFLTKVADVSEEAGLRFRQATVVSQFEREAVHCANVVRHLKNSGEHGQRLSPCREIYSVVLVFAAHRRARMDAVRFEPDERKAVFQFAYVREEQTGRFVEHHGDDVVWASGVELSEVSRFVNEYLYSACHVSIKNGGSFPALGWTFTPAHGAVPPIGGTGGSLPNPRAQRKGTCEKSFLREAFAGG